MAVLFENTVESCFAVLGTWLAGACVVSLPSIARGMDPSTYAGQLRRILAQVEPQAVAATAGTAGLLGHLRLGVEVTPL